MINDYVYIFVLVVLGLLEITLKVAKNWLIAKMEIRESFFDALKKWVCNYVALTTMKIAMLVYISRHILMGHLPLMCFYIVDISIQLIEAIQTIFEAIGCKTES